MKKFLTVCLCCVILLAAYCVSKDLANPDVQPSEAADSPADVQQGISFDGDFKPGGRVIAMYDHGYASVEELLEDATLIVRATPIEIEGESDFAVCWVLRVEEANKDGVEIIRLRQIKDEYLLTAGQEVVLALEPESDDGYYHIPGGGCGLFRANAAGTVSGMLLESLKQQAPAPYSSESVTELTLCDIFDILRDLSCQ